MEINLNCPHCHHSTKYTLTQSTPSNQPPTDLDIMVQEWLQQIPKYKTIKPRPAREWFDDFQAWTADTYPSAPDVSQRKFTTAAIGHGATFRRVSGGTRAYTMPAIGPAVVDDDQLAADIRAVESWSATMDPAEVEQWQWVEEKFLVAMYEVTTPEADRIPRLRFTAAVRSSFHWRHHHTPVRGYSYAYLGPDGDTGPATNDTTMDGDGLVDDGGPDTGGFRFPDLPDPYTDDGGMDGGDNPGMSVGLTFAQLLAMAPPADGGHTDDDGTTFPDLPGY